jgi:NAD(P)-dependent dehydrogenase (short-subunit alcohol dehydrogenase family)
MTDQQATLLHGRIALVTGANRGIGLATARGLVSLGATVIVGARKQEDAASACASLGPSVEPAVLDVTQPQSVAALRDMVVARHGRLDVLVNNAGVALDQWVSGLDVSLDTVRQTYEVNVLGALACCQAFLPAMMAQGWGRVVNVSSELGSMGPPSQFGGTIAYRSSKAALNAITRFLAVEAGKVAGVKINATCPGWVRTQLGGPDAPRTVEEGADTAVWLASLPDHGPSGQLFRDREPYPW